MDIDTVSISGFEIRRKIKERMRQTAKTMTMIVKE